MRNGYTIPYHEAAYGVLGAEGILFSRSGYVGAQAFPGCWSGDNEPNFGAENGLPSVIVASQSAAMSGYAIWGHDIGGYQDVNLSATPENLFMRWTQFGAFTPLMQMHRQVALEMQYPWSFGPEGLANYREYARLHTELFPYIYSYARIAQDTGLPIIRPLVLHWPDDPDVWAVQHTYLFGEAFLVAPMVTNEQTERTVYLPEGTWLDFWSHERIEGGDFHDWTNADQTRLPLFVREGAIVPKLAEIPQTLHDAAYVGDPSIATIGDGWAFLVVPAASPTAFTAYDDTSVNVEPAADGELTITLEGPARPVRFEVIAAEPMWVGVDEQPLPRVDDLVGVDAGWTVVDDTVVAKFEHDGQSVLFFGDEPPSGGDTTGGSTSDGTVGDGSGAAGPGDGSLTAQTAGNTDTDTPGQSGSDGCGCRSGPPAASWLLLLLAGLRRRQTPAQRAATNGSAASVLEK
jgi:alpha-D-xyloside xylohydrolase